MLRWSAQRLATARLGIHKPSQIRHISNKSTKPNPTKPLQTPVRPPPRSYLRRLADVDLSLVSKWLWGTCGVVFAVHVVTDYVGFIGAAYGISMLPTFNSSGDWVYISKWYRRGRGVQVGDVVSFKHPVREGERAVKRIIGMEGDHVLVNTPGKSDAMIQVPQGHCWVVGDNMAHSRDSRMYGALPLALIQGKVTFKFNISKGTREFTWIEDGLQPAYEYDDLD